MKTILVPLDGSELAEQALPIAVRLARATGAELLLVRVLPQPLDDPMGRRLHPNGARPYLERLACREEGIRARVFLPKGAPREQIIRLARRYEVDLIVMTTHGRTGLQRWLMGSVAERVVRASPCPVLLLRSGVPITPFRRALLPVDGSDASYAAVEGVLPFLTGPSQRTLLWATNLLPLDLDRDTREEIAVELEAELRERFPELPHKVFDGDASDVIVTHSRDEGFDLIAMTTHGRSGFKRFALGSVTERVVRHAPCAVLVFPSKEDR